MSEQVFLSLGSNLGDRVEALRAAVRALRAMADVRFVAASPLYETEPWETEPGRLRDEQQWYLNCVVQIDTMLSPAELLGRLQGLEEQAGRTRVSGHHDLERFAPRTLDIDILLYGHHVISARDNLHVPHLLFHERAFVLRPLADLVPEFEHPTLYRTVRQLLDDLVDEHEVRPSAFPARWFEE